MRTYAAGVAAIKAAPRCGAWGRQKQRPCQQPATRGRKRCRMHGGRNIGPPPGNKNALKHVRYSTAAVDAKREVAAVARKVRSAVAAAVRAAEAVTKRPRGRPPIHGATLPLVLLQIEASSWSAA